MTGVSATTAARAPRAMAAAADATGATAVGPAELGTAAGVGVRTSVGTARAGVIAGPAVGASARWTCRSEPVGWDTAAGGGAVATYSTMKMGIPRDNAGRTNTGPASRANPYDGNP